MTGWVVRQFKGIAPKLAPRLLADNQAQSCTNARFKSGTLQPIKANEPVMTLPKSGAIQTIHRFGQGLRPTINIGFIGLPTWMWFAGSWPAMHRSGLTGLATAFPR